MSTWPVLVLGIYLWYLVYLSTWSTVLDPNPGVYQTYFTVYKSRICNQRTQFYTALDRAAPGQLVKLALKVAMKYVLGCDIKMSKSAKVLIQSR